MPATCARWHLNLLSRATGGLAVALALAVPAVAGQAADPKVAFTEALGQFSLALAGTDGDEGPRIRASLDRMDRALEEWDEVIRSYEAGMAAEIGSAAPPLAARMHMALGGIYLDRGRLEDALRAFVSALRLDPSRSDTQILQGLAFGQLANDPVAAAQALRKASAMDPNDPIRSYLFARALLKSGEPDAAKNALARVHASQKPGAASQVEPGGPKPFLRLGLVEEVPGVEPFFPPVLYADGFSLLKGGDYRRAIGQLREATTRDPVAGNPGVEAGAMGRAAEAIRAGSVETSLQHLKTAIELAPDRAEPRRILGLVLVANGEYDSAITEIETATRASPAEERPRLALATALVAAGRLRDAVESLRATLTMLPASGQAHYTLGRAYQRQGLYTEALAAFEKAVTFEPPLGLSSLLQMMGSLRRAQQDLDGALEAFGRRIDVTPNDPKAHLEMGELYVLQGRHDEALAEFAVVLLLDPADAQAHAAIGQVHFRDGRYADAVESSRRAVDLNPRHQQARYVLATSLIRLGRADEGKRELEVYTRLRDEEAAAK